MSNTLKKGTRAPFIRAGWFAIFVAAFLAACGGGGPETQVPAAQTVVTTAAVTVQTFAKPAIGVAQAPASVKKFALSAQLTANVVDPYGGVSPVEAVTQLFDKVAETTYSEFFPPKKFSLDWADWNYRYYPETGVYVGVPIHAAPASGLIPGGVYVMGGTFGEVPTYVAPLTQFITPVKPCEAGYARNAYGCVEAWWAAARIAPVGERVVGANRLPVGCITWRQQCWRDAVANGTVKFVATLATMIGYSSRPVVFAYFRNNNSGFGITGLWATLPFYADDGTPVSFDIQSGTASELDWIAGSTSGMIAHVPGDSFCTEMYFQGFSWSPRPVACPA